MVHGIARGMGIDETVQSPSFTISRVYEAPSGQQLVHYDFYRLNGPGIMREELDETIADEKNSVVIEWADSVEDVLPTDKLVITIEPTTEDRRRLAVAAGGTKSYTLLGKLA